MKKLTALFSAALIILAPLNTGVASAGYALFTQRQQAEDSVNDREEAINQAVRELDKKIERTRKELEETGTDLNENQTPKFNGIG